MEMPYRADLAAGSAEPQALARITRRAHATGRTQCLRRANAIGSSQYAHRMKGAIAAGHPRTAEAGARMLAEGGNAVDACLAAAFVSWVAESPLTGPGGGGFLLVHNAHDRKDRVLDFFVTVPGTGLPRGTVGEMETVDVDFDSTI